MTVKILLFSNISKRNVFLFNKQLKLKGNESKIHSLLRI